MNHPSQYDIVSIGETMIRFSPPGHERLEQSRSFELHVGGSESNTMAGLSRLGSATCWISRLTRHAIGRMIEGAIAAHGVDTRWIQWTDSDRIGSYYYETGSASRPSEVIYDRAHSAYSNFSASDLPSYPLQHTKVLHLTGISLALSDCVRTSLAAARDIATQAGAKISFDFNYRAKLWSMSEARVHCTDWMERSDLVFIAQRDASEWLDIKERISDESVFARLIARRAKGITVMTLGAQGAMASDGKRTVRLGTTPIEGVGRLGAGDAFSAGFLFGWLQGWDIEHSLKWANVAAQHKLTTPGDLPWFTLQDLQRAVDGESGTRLYR